MSEAAPSQGYTDCPFCEAEISSTAKKCRYCGEWVWRDCLGCGTPIRREWAAAGRCASCQAKVALAGEPALPAVRGKSRITAGVLAVILGGVGAHKWYLGNWAQGLFYLVFCWTFIPAVVGLIEGIFYLESSDEAFQAKHG